MAIGKRSGARAAKPTDDMVSAMVIVRAASGRPLAGSDAIDSSTLSMHAPAPADVRAAQQSCASLEFTVGPCIGISFAITARQSRFESVFGVHLRITRDGSIVVTRSGKTLGPELPLDQLSATLRALVETVTFTPPVDLHDTDLMI